MHTGKISKKSRQVGTVDFGAFAAAQLGEGGGFHRHVHHHGLADLQDARVSGGGSRGAPGRCFTIAGSVAAGLWHRGVHAADGGGGQACFRCRAGAGCPRRFGTGRKRPWQGSSRRSAATTTRGAGGALTQARDLGRIATAVYREPSIGCRRRAPQQDFEREVPGILRGGESSECERGKAVESIHRQPRVRSR